MSKTLATEIWKYESGGYQWVDFYVYQHPRESEKYAADIQSGCSCYRYETPDDFNLATETPLTKAEVISRWQDFADDMSAQEKVRGLENLQEVLH